MKIYWTDRQLYFNSDNTDISYTRQTLNNTLVMSVTLWRVIRPAGGWLVTSCSLPQWLIEYAQHQTSC